MTSLAPENKPDATPSQDKVEQQAQAAPKVESKSNEQKAATGRA